jgi:hypothetical protein
MGDGQRRFSQDEAVFRPKERDAPLAPVAHELRLVVFGCVAEERQFESPFAVLGGVAGSLVATRLGQHGDHVFAKADTGRPPTADRDSHLDRLPIVLDADPSVARCQRHHTSGLAHHTIGRGQARVPGSARKINFSTVRGAIKCSADDDLQPGQRPRQLRLARLNSNAGNVGSRRSRNDDTQTCGHQNHGERDRNLASGSIWHVQFRTMPSFSRRWSMSRNAAEPSGSQYSVVSGAA